MQQHNRMASAFAAHYNIVVYAFLAVAFCGVLTAYIPVKIGKATAYKLLCNILAYRLVIAVYAAAGKTEDAWNIARYILNVFKAGFKIA